MIVEHTFVTVLDHESAFHAAGMVLTPLGFGPPKSAPKPVPSPHLEWARGKKTPYKAKRLTHLPQRVRIEFDRGRVDLAYAVTERSAGRPRKRSKSHATALVSAIEAALTGEREATDIVASMQAMEADMNRRDIRGRIIAATVGLTITFAVVALIIWAVVAP